MTYRHMPDAQSPSGKGRVLSRKAFTAMSLPSTARMWLLFPASWATVISFQSRYRSGRAGPLGRWDVWTQGNSGRKPAITPDSGNVPVARDKNKCPAGVLTSGAPRQLTVLRMEQRRPEYLAVPSAETKHAAIGARGRECVGPEEVILSQPLGTGCIGSVSLPDDARSLGYTGRRLPLCVLLALK